MTGGRLRRQPSSQLVVSFHMWLSAFALSLSVATNECQPPHLPPTHCHQMKPWLQFSTPHTAAVTVTGEGEQQQPLAHSACTCNKGLRLRSTGRHYFADARSKSTDLRCLMLDAFSTLNVRIRDVALTTLWILQLLVRQPFK